MKVSKQSRQDAKALLAVCRSNGLLDEAKVRIAVTALVQRKPRGFVGTLAHFHRLLKLDIQRRTALVESAVSLTPEMQNKIGVSLGARHGMGLDVQFTASPALIGGLRVKVGSDVYDGSVAGRLAALADSF